MILANRSSMPMGVEGDEEGDDIEYNGDGVCSEKLILQEG